MNRNGGWIQTFTGRRVWPLDPLPEDIDIADIAHSLSMQCRFSGHTERFYSVAEHSCHVFDIVSQFAPGESLWALLHDGPEAFLVDLPRPLKEMPEFAPYRRAERRLMGAICRAFGLPEDQPISVSNADAEMLGTEARQALKPERLKDWTYLPDRRPGIYLKFWSPRIAERAFLKRYNAARSLTKPTTERTAP